MPIPERDFTLKTALMIYEGGPGDCYVESHPVEPGADGKPALGAGKPLTMKGAKALAVSLGAEIASEGRGLIPETVLGVKLDGSACWWCPAATRLMHCNKQTGVTSGQAPFPPLFFSLDGNRLSVFALGEDRRPGPEARLYRAPFWNCGADGGVCMGTAKDEKDGKVADVAASAERGFFESEFSHELGQGALKEGTLEGLWGRLIGSGKPFPMNVLEKSQAGTLGDYMAREGF